MKSAMRYHGVLAAMLVLVALPLGGATGVSLPTFGEPLAGLSAGDTDEFLDGLEDFEEVETEADGLGPVFNGRSCAECHSNPAVGGDSNILETRFGRYDGSPRHPEFNPLAERGGSLMQAQGLAATGPCAPETVPRGATVVAGRKTTPLFGMGFVDNVPDRVLYAIAAAQQRFAPTLAGRVNTVVDTATGLLRAGRFGWKAQQPSLFTFSGDAYLNEMGITSPLFPSENAPNGDLARLQACDHVNDPEDDGSGVIAFFNFMTRLAPPSRGPITAAVRAGESLFMVGCAVCHVPTLVTGSHDIQALDRVTFQPYSDFLLHDMGSLGDGIEQGQARGSEMRTAPLWGLRVRTAFLHDGRARTVADAILAHDGQGRPAQAFFTRLTRAQQANLLAFLQSL